MPESPLLRYLERKSGLIAYVGLDGNIYTIDQGGGKQTAVTTDADLSDPNNAFLIYQFPTWSRNGQRLAYVGIRGGRTQQTAASLYLMDFSEKKLIEAFRSDTELPFFLYWSPDNERISFLTSSPDSEAMTLRLASFGLDSAEILDSGRPYYWVWSPDGQRVVVHTGGSSDRNPEARVSSLTIGNEIRENRLNLNPHRFQSPDWSPDGSQLLLAGKNQQGQGVLYQANLRGTPSRQLATFDQAIAFSWSPDGKFVAYVAVEQEVSVVLGQLSVLRMESLEQVPTPDEEVLAFFWSPDSEKIAYLVPFLDPESEGEVSGENLLLELKVLEVKDGETRTLTTFRPSDSFISILPFFDQYARAATIWSPDSENVVIAALEPGGVPTIWVVPVSGRLPPRFITAGEIAFWSWK